MEKKRRARINNSLEDLKRILLESRAAISVPSERGGGGQRSAKLEKADILEMTVGYLRQLRGRLDDAALTKEGVAVRAADSSSGEGLQEVRGRQEAGGVWRPW